MKKLSYMYVVRDAEKLSTSCTFFVSILLLNGISIKMTSGYIAIIVVLWDEYETNFHFIFVLDYRVENNMKMTKISSTESPMLSFGKISKITLNMISFSNIMNKKSYWILDFISQNYETIHVNMCVDIQSWRVDCLNWSVLQITKLGWRKSFWVLIVPYMPFSFCVTTLSV